MEAAVQSPFYKRLSLNLISICLLGAIVVLGKSIITPILLAILFATLLLPVTRWLQNHKFNKPLSILTPLLLAMALVGMIIFFIATQVGNFADDIPALKEKGVTVIGNFQQWIDENAHIAVRKQNQYFKQGMENLKQQAPKIVGVTFASLAGILTYVILIPLYTFLILFYRKTIKEFLVGCFRNGSTKKVNEVLEESTTVAQQYVTGLMIETTIVFTLNTIGFLILGIKYAVFLALLAAILNLIPYVGIISANIICMIITLLTSENSSDVIWVGVILGVVQLFDNNVGMPVIVGNKVRINALVTIIGVFTGGALLGIPGMFLAIPALAVAKIIADKVQDLKPWGIMLGDDSEESKAAKATTSTLSIFRRQKAKREKREKEEVVK